MMSAMATLRPHQTILIIDDNPDNLRIAVDLLAAYSFDVRTARDGRIGLRRARNGEPDLILLDVQMPGIDGYETCKQLKADPDLADIPVIFMTARSDVQDKVRAFEVGGVDYVTKPFEAQELLARVRIQLKVRALQTELFDRNEHLEERVAEQTASLRSEIAMRELYDEQRDHLLSLVRSQSEEMRRITRTWMDERNTRDQHLASNLKEHITARLEMVTAHLTQARELMPNEGGDWVDPEDCRQHLDTAAALLTPVLKGSVELQSSLVQKAQTPDDNLLLSLSTREYEVMKLLADGRANKEIAYTLGVAPSTVSTYRNRILEKLGAEDIPSLIRILLQHEARA
ncbi:MAG: FixJ family two-component response regulator [Myxococcota bacterium]|jgi:FixJ family two-component response regulator